MRIDYVNADGDISNYLPDFIVKKSDKEIFIIETRGQEDPDVPLKMNCLKQWCEDVNKSQKIIIFDYMFVGEESLHKYSPSSFEQLVNTFEEYKVE